MALLVSQGHAQPVTTLQPDSLSFAPREIFTKSGVRLRAAAFPPASGASPRGVCVLLNGQTEFIEKYFEVVGELATRGFAVATMDWRGQGGSARALANPLKAHIESFNEYDEDLAALMEQVVAPLNSKATFALAHSMGAHNLLRMLHERPNAFKCAVLIAPMIAVSTRGNPAWLARMVAAAMNIRGASSDWVWGMAARDPLRMTFADQLVTSDPVRFQRAQDFLADHPDIRLAGPTWGWLEAAYRSMHAITAPGYAEAITTPTLVFGAGRDQICLTPATRAFSARLPHGEYVEFADAEHEILMENDSIRGRFWSDFDAFVGKYV